jgi:hypothetical protein
MMETIDIGHRKANLLGLMCALVGFVLTIGFAVGISGVTLPLWAGMALFGGFAFLGWLFLEAGNPPIERFDFGETNDHATYRGVSLDTTIKVRTGSAPVKHRIVRITARNNGEEIAHRATRQEVGVTVWPVTGDFELVRSNSAHVAAVADRGSSSMKSPR